MRSAWRQNRWFRVAGDTRQHWRHGAAGPKPDFLCQLFVGNGIGEIANCLAHEGLQLQQIKRFPILLPWLPGTPYPPLQCDGLRFRLLPLIQARSDTSRLSEHVTDLVVAESRSKSPKLPAFL